MEAVVRELSLGCVCQVGSVTATPLRCGLGSRGQEGRQGLGIIEQGKVAALMQSRGAQSFACDDVSCVAVLLMMSVGFRARLVPQPVGALQYICREAKTCCDTRQRGAGPRS